MKKKANQHMEFDHAEVSPMNYPKGTVLIAPTSVGFTYDRVLGDDILGLLVDTGDLGSFLLAVTPDAARHIAASLDSMVANLPRLRSEHQALEAQ
jgi:hypothetical protein